MLTSTSSAIATSRRRITSTVTGSSAASSAPRASLAAVNVDLLELADRKTVARPDQRARSVFLDQRRAASGKPDRQSVAVMDGGVEKAVLFQKEDRTPSRPRRMGAALHFGAPRRRRGRITVAVDQPGELPPHHLQGGGRMQQHPL